MNKKLASLMVGCLTVGAINFGLDTVSNTTVGTGSSDMGVTTAHAEAPAVNTHIDRANATTYISTMIGDTNMMINGVNTKVTADEEVVIDLSRNFHEYKVARNLAGLNEILTPDFVLVHMTGYQQPRAEWLSQVEDEQMKYYSSTEEHISYKVNGNRAIVVTQNRVDARIYGYRNTWPLQLTFTMVKENGTWMIQHADATTY